MVHPYAWCAALVAVGTFLAINPYYLFNFQEAMKQNRNDYRIYQMGSAYLRPYGYFYLFHWGIGRLPSLAIIVGFLIMLFKKPFSWLLVNSFVFVLLFIMTYYSRGGIYTRNFIPLMPYLMIFAGFAADYFYERIKPFSGKYAGILVGLALIIINVMPLYNTLILDVYYSTTWNKERMHEWIVNTLPADTTVRSYRLFMLDLENKAIKAKNFKFLDWDYNKGENSLAEFQEEGTDFAILQISSFQNSTYMWRTSLPTAILFRYSGVPFDYITNSFFGLTVREFLPYTVAEIYKPWQARDHGFLVFKIPKLPKKKGHSIAVFDKEAINAWEQVDPWGFGRKDQTFRISSPPVPVTAGKQYVISGLLKQEGYETAKYDGYLRLDFYTDQQDYLKKTMGLGVALSSRVLPDGRWTTKEFLATAPANAHFAMISFQRFSPQFDNSIDISRVEIFEANDLPSEPFPEIPYLRSVIDYEDIFSNSFF